MITSPTELIAVDWRSQSTNCCSRHITGKPRAVTGSVLIHLSSNCCQVMIVVRGCHYPPPGGGLLAAAAWLCIKIALRDSDALSVVYVDYCFTTNVQLKRVELLHGLVGWVIPNLNLVKDQVQVQVRSVDSDHCSVSLAANLMNSIHSTSR